MNSKVIDIGQSNAYMDSIFYILMLNIVMKQYKLIVKTHGM